MTEGSTLPVAGWYDDPEIAMRLRWWDGSRWSQHTRPRPITQSAPALSGSTVDHPPSDTSAGPDAAPEAKEPYSYSVPFSATPSSAPSSAAAGGAGRPAQLGTFGSRSVTRKDLWNTTAQSMEYTPERTITASAWMLSATPVVAYLAQAAVTMLVSLESTPWFWIVAAGLLPIMWIIIFVRRDREKLHEWGHLERASGWWALLGQIGYLTARGIIVQRHGSSDWWPLVVTLLLTAGFVSLGIFAPALLLVFMTPLQ